MSEKRNVPELRFPEFMNDWETVELFTVTNKISVGIATEVRPYVSQLKEVPILRNQNIKAGYFDDSDIEYITKEFDETNRTKRVKANDLLIVRTGSNIGNACVVPVDFENSQTFTTLIVRPRSSALNSEFLSQHVNFKGLSEIARLSAGAGKPNLNAGFLKRYRISIPSLEEQQKIAEFLIALDKRIELLQTKKEKLEAYKKGVMQQIFSQKLRFKADDGSDFPEWEEKKLGDICEIVKGKQLNRSELFETGDYPAMNGGISPSGYTDEWNTSENTITISEGGNSCGYVSFIKTKFWSGGHCYSLQKVKSNVSNLFLFQVLKFNQDGLMSLRVGSGLPNIQKKDVLKFKIPIPSKDEQTKIVQFLTRLDSSIGNLNQQITHTQTWKKGLLQKMFV